MDFPAFYEELFPLYSIIYYLKIIKFLREAFFKGKKVTKTLRISSNEIFFNERGEYGKPYEYLKMWEEAAKMGHLESMTDLGYLYENGLEEEGRTII